MIVKIIVIYLTFKFLNLHSLITFQIRERSFDVKSKNDEVK